MTENRLDLATVQERLRAEHGRRYWRSLEELADTPAFQEFLQREFPRQAAEWVDGMSRRHFLKLMGASLALAGLTSCTVQPPETIVPAVLDPEQAPTRDARYYATAMQLGGYALGLLAHSQQGRPTKLEGNPDHPASLGATDAWAQASILTLYDPDRSQAITHEGATATWAEFLAALQTVLEPLQATGGAGVRILTESISSPTLADQLQAVLTTFPQAVWHHYEPINRENVYAGAALAFGEPAEPIYRLSQAAVVVCLDADLFATSPGRVRYAREFADARRANNRLYVLESTPTITGGAADHRLPLRASQIESAARQLAAALGVAVVAEDTPLPDEWLTALVNDLQAHAGNSLVIAEDGQPAVVHALAHAINDLLGNVGQTLVYSEPVLATATSHTESLGELVAAMQAGEVELLLILGGNPVYTAPAALNFAAALAQVPTRIHLGLYADETSARCQWHLPESHYLESWSDGRAYDGTVTIQQPLIEPLYASHSAHEVIDALINPEPRASYAIVQAYWQAQLGEAAFATAWPTALHDGFVADSALPPKTVTLQSTFAEPANPPTANDALELSVRPDPTLWDGRFANNGWLQELPKPITKLTWENAVLVSPQTAATLGLTQGDLVEVTSPAGTLSGPIWVLPGQAAGVLTVHLGYGRGAAGAVGNGAGFDAYAARPAGAAWFVQGVTVRKVGAGHQFASTQDHHSMEGRDLIRVGTVAQFAADPEFAHALDAHGEVISLYPKYEYPENSWGMAVDLTACIGCNACVTACQAENNIPIVGKEEVITGREMHWIRIDTYFEGETLDNPAIHHQPVMCMHCENAPCEVVCPVAATVHDAEGLNTMIYNRCVGTRYCSNNCPYKVRRFNFLDYTSSASESLKLQHNPNVTVRARGVMEKCTYCVQRISAARITAQIEGRDLADGDVVTACQSACPTRAIVFGNLNDATSEVAQRKASPLNYGLLTELNTNPRTSYLAKLRNPNPSLDT